VSDLLTMAAPDQLWRFALAAIPLAMIVAATCRWLPCRPSTRHMMWLTLLMLLVVAPFLPAAPVPDLTTLADSPASAAPAGPASPDERRETRRKTR